MRLRSEHERRLGFLRHPRAAHRLAGLCLDLEHRPELTGR